MQPPLTPHPSIQKKSWEAEWAKNSPNKVNAKPKWNTLPEIPQGGRLIRNHPKETHTDTKQPQKRRENATSHLERSVIAKVESWYF